MGETTKNKHRNCFAAYSWQVLTIPNSIFHKASGGWTKHAGG
jgi:hypothetical protein